MKASEKSISFLKKYKWVLLISGIALVFGGYFVIKKYGKELSEMQIFTKYPDRNAVNKLVSDTIKTNLISLDSFDNTIPGLDSLESPSLMVQKKEPSKDESFYFAPEKGDSFDELIHTSNRSENDRNTYLQLYQKDILTSKSLFKIAAVAGKNILQNKAEGMLEVFETLEMEEEIEGIILNDRDGKIVYATNTKFKNNYISDIAPAFPIEDTGFNWLSKDGKTTTRIPIFSTYGNIGNIIITTRD